MNQETQNQDEQADRTPAPQPEEHPIHYPRFIDKFGVWPVNIGLFFFYNNIVSLAVLIAGLIIMTSTGVTDQAVITEKLGGLSVISTLITLGLTLIYSRRFYFSRD